MLKLIAVAALAAAARAGEAPAQDAAKDPSAVAPQQVNVVFENDKVRVSKFQAKPGAEIPLHHHPDHLVYPLKDCSMALTGEEGGRQEVTLKAEKPAYMESVDHSTKILGDQACDALVIELKEEDEKTENLDPEAPRQ